MSALSSRLPLIHFLFSLSSWVFFLPPFCHIIVPLSFPPFYSWFLFAFFLSFSSFYVCSFTSRPIIQFSFLSSWISLPFLLVLLCRFLFVFSSFVILSFRLVLFIFLLCLFFHLVFPYFFYMRLSKSPPFFCSFIPCLSLLCSFIFHLCSFNHGLFPLHTTPSHALVFPLFNSFFLTFLSY